MRCLSRCTFLMFALVGIASPNAFAQKLKISQVVWGFDGRVTPNQFNPVSILVDNPSDEAFEGRISIRQSSGTGQAVGASFVENGVYIQALGRRWLQFVPYVGTNPDNDEWKLRWERKVSDLAVAIRPLRGDELLPAVKSGQDAFVALSGTGGLTTGRKGVRNFDEAIFPTAATATHGLRSVVLDHVPRWEQPRRQAFADWLRLGGQLHLLKSEDGDYPKFTEELAILNGPQAQQRVGSGVIFRYDMQATALDSTFPKRARTLENAFLQVPEAGADEALERAIEQRRADVEMGRTSSLEYGWDVAERTQNSLIEMTQPDHNWLLIYVLAILYILIIFPGCYLVGKRRAHYLVTYGAILGAATLFSLAFLYVGQRGYGEQAKVNAVAIAKKIDGDRWDVIQWSNVFVTSGDTYSLAHSGEGMVYATGQVTEPVRGSIGLRESDDGVKRSFEVEIPPFSNRPYVHRQMIALPDFGAQLESVGFKEDLSEAVVKVGEGLRKVLGKIKFEPVNRDGYEYGYVQSRQELPVVRLVYRTSVFAMKVNETTGTLTLGARLGKIHQFLDMRSLNSYSYSVGYLYDQEKESNEETYSKLFDSMTAHHFGIFKDADFMEARLPPDRVRLLIYTKMPDEMFIKGETFTNQSGYVLFSQDLPLDTTP